MVEQCFLLGWKMRDGGWSNEYHNITALTSIYIYIKNHQSFMGWMFFLLHSPLFTISIIS